MNQQNITVQIDLDTRGFEQALANLKRTTEQSMASVGRSVVDGLSSFNTIASTVGHIKTMQDALAGLIAAMTTGKAVVPALKAGITGLNAALSANKIGLVIAGIGAAVALFSSETNRANTSANTLTQSLINMNEEFERSREIHQGNINQIRHQGAVNDVLAQSIITLAREENKTLEQRARMLNYIDILNRNIPNLALVWDEETRSLNMSTDALMKNVQMRANKDELVEHQKHLNDLRRQGIKYQEKLKEAEDALYNARLSQNRFYHAVRSNPVYIVPYLRESRMIRNAISEAQEAVDKTDVSLSNIKEKIESTTKMMTNISMDIHSVFDTMTTSADTATDATQTLGIAVNAASEAIRKKQNAISDQRYDAGISLQQEIELWKELRDEQAKFVEGSDERRTINREIHRLETQLAQESANAERERQAAAEQAAREREAAVRAQFAAEKQVIADRVHFEGIGTAEQIAMWEKLAVRYGANAEFRRDIDRNLFDLRQRLNREMFDADKQAIADRVHFEGIGTAEQIAMWEYLQVKYREHRDFMADIDRSLFDLRQRHERELTSNFMAEVNNRLAYTQLSEREQLQHKIDAIEAEIQARRGANLQYQSLQEELNNNLSALSRVHFREEMGQLQEMQGQKERNFRAEFDFLTQLAQKYRQNGAIQKDISNQVANLQREILQNIDSMTNNFGQAFSDRARQIFDGFDILNMIPRVDFDAENAKVEQRTNEAHDSRRDINDLTAQANANLRQQTDLTNRINSLESQRNAIYEQRSGILSRIADAQDKDEIGVLQAQLTSFNAEYERISTAIDGVVQSLNDTEAENQKIKEGISAEIQSLTEKYPGLLEFYDEATSKLSLTNAELERYIENQRTIEKEAVRSKPADQFLQNLRDTHQAAQDFLSGMESLSERGLHEDIMADLSRGGVNNLHKVQALLQMTGEQFNEAQNLILALQADAINQAEFEFRDKGEQLQEEILDMLKALGESGYELSFEVGSKIAERIIDGLRSKFPELSETAEEFISSIFSGDAQPGFEGGTDYDTGIQAGQAIAGGVAEGFVEKAPEAQDTMSDKINLMLETMEQISYVSSNPIGMSIVSGISAGFQAMLPSLTAQVQAGMAAVHAATSGFLGINSPSRLFRDSIGKNIVRGIQAGIDDEMPGLAERLERQMDLCVDIAHRSMFPDFKSANVINPQTAIMAATAQINALLERIAQIGEQQVTPNVNVTLEPQGDLRGFFEYISTSIKRVDYLSGVTPGV